MQYCKCLIISCFVLFCSINLFAQEESDITGLWKGTMYNDTTQQYLKYEIAISQKKGKLYGFTHTYFIVDNKEYHGVKKVKIRKVDGKIIVEDVELIVHNYPIPPNKGVRQLDVLTLEIKDGVMTLSGPFSTNRTKVYYSLTGSINVQRKTNFSQSALVPHLEELGLADELSFVQEEKMKAIATVVTPKNTEVETVTEQPVVKTKPVEKEKMTKEKIIKAKPVKEKEATKTEEVVVKKEPQQTSTPKPTQAAADIDKRTIETIQSVYYKTDSLELTLYDNGEVDGDTVSVLMNGEVIMPRVGLSTNAIRKKISTVNTGDSIQLIMYAENLGLLPPNTGLLIVYDGTVRHEIRFSGNLQKSAAIVFRRKQD